MVSPAPIAGNGRPNVTVGFPAAIDVSPTARHVTSTSADPLSLRHPTLTWRPNRAPSVTYSLALQAHVDTCESLLKRLHIANDQERSCLLEEYFNGSGERNDNGKRKRVSITKERQDGSVMTEYPSSENELTEILNETSVDEDGRICFYGTTSSFHLQLDKVLGPQAGERPHTVGMLGDQLSNAKMLNHEPISRCISCEFTIVRDISIRKDVLM